MQAATHREDSGHTRRRHPRTETEGQVVAQITDTDVDSLVGVTFHSDIVEVSPCGMRLSTDVMVESGKLDLWASVEGHPVKMFLSTEIRWASNGPDGSFLLGVEIADNPLSDLDEWCEFQRKEWFRHKAEVA